MQKLTSLAALLLFSTMANAQNGSEVPQKIERSHLEYRRGDRQLAKPLTAEKLWDLGRVSAEGIWKNGKQLVYGVSHYDLKSNSTSKDLYMVPIDGGTPVQLTSQPGSESLLKIDGDDAYYMLSGQIWKKNLKAGEAVQITDYPDGLQNVRISPDGKHILFSKAVLVKPFHSKDKYADLAQSNVYVYDALDYRHWDTWNDGRFNHPIVASFDEGKISGEVDLLEGQPFYSPQMPYGGAEDFLWSADGQSVYYVSKKSFGTEYAQSTNTDIYRYDLKTKETHNITEGMPGYDMSPSLDDQNEFIAWLSMATPGYEADKNDIIVMNLSSGEKQNLTKHWDGTVNSFLWSEDGAKIYFLAPTKGTVQLFELAFSRNDRNDAPAIRQISSGQFDINELVSQTENGFIVTSTTMNRASEIYAYSIADNQLKPISRVNDEKYSQIASVQVEPRVTKASDGKDLFSWVIYPPNFDPAKKYPTLLYCQGGPQSAVTQSYSFRWNFQLLASQGYIVIAPNRRGMPGWGVDWNAEISGDWGGQPIRDYLAAIDDLAQEPYVDKERLGAVGASYGGYSVFQLAGVHEGRFKTFISHCGLFDMVSWYSNTEELFFANHDLGGPYWEEKNAKTYNEFNPIKHVDKWDTPILIIQGGRDFRVPIGQGLAAFQAAQLKGIKSRLMYLPDENHWVLDGQNAQVWNREFFSWLKETL